MSYQGLLSGDRRRIILDALQTDADYEHSEEVLGVILEYFSHRVSREVLRADLDWLADRRLVALSMRDTVLSVRLTRRGEDVALGREIVPGVSRAHP